MREKLKKLLPPERYRHSLRVEAAAILLADHYKVNRSKASLAGLLHDCSRFLSCKQMLIKARRFGIPIGPMEKLEPKLLHAKLSAKIARQDFKIKDRQVLSAIALHTVGAEKMSKLDKIIYLADHIEGERNYKEVQKVRKLAFLDLDSAIVESTGAMIKYLLLKDLPVSCETVKTRNAHLSWKKTNL